MRVPISVLSMDKASEWLTYWRLELRLAAAALALLGIFSAVWRWNYSVALIELSRKELYTLQVGLNVYSREFNVQWHFILDMALSR